MVIENRALKEIFEKLHNFHSTKYIIIAKSRGRIGI
jgi:hypothetical protein